MMSKQVRQLLRENNEMEKLLSEDGRSVMTDIVVYLRCADISDIDRAGAAGYHADADRR